MPKKEEPEPPQGGEGSDPREDSVVRPVAEPKAELEKVEQFSFKYLPNHQL